MMNQKPDVQQHRLICGMTPCEHLVHFYEEEGIFLDMLDVFLVGGLRKGESVIVIATPAHLKALDEHLATYGVNTSRLKKLNQYICADAKETLGRFMVNGLPNERLFKEVVMELLDRARMGGRKVRAFGEMVALLWSEGNNDGTVQLERLWHQFCQKESFSLYCAYPRQSFKRRSKSSFKAICDAHSKVIGGDAFFGLA
jgi:hypothetical protein